MVDTETGEVISTDLALPGVADLELADDPAGQIVLACERAKAWLASGIAISIEAIVDTKAQAAAIATFAIQKQLGKDAELAALEVQRRAETGTALAVKRGQEAGSITRRHETLRRPSHDRAAAPDHAPSDFFGHSQERKQAYVMAEAAPAVLDAAIDQAKAEGNLSRANVVRKIKGQAAKVPISQQLDRIEELAAEGWHSTQIAKELGTSSDNIRTLARKAGIKITADDVLRGAQHHIDMTRYARETVAAIENAATGLALLDYADIDIDEATQQEWVATLDDSLRALNRFRKHIKEMTTHA